MRFQIPRARTRTVATDSSGMNKLERRYAEHLEARRLAGEVAAWMFDAVNLRLADRTYYKPDFLVLLANGEVEFHEVKGFWEDDARVKIKVAADRFPWFRVVACRWVKKQWQFEVFGE